MTNKILTTVYFVRHAQADNANRDAANRVLTEKGMLDRKCATKYLQDKKIDIVFSSPYRRAIDTVKDFADSNGLPIHIVDGFKERISDSDWDRVNDYVSFIERQWCDFDYKLSDGECLNEVQCRNIEALNSILEQQKGKNIVIGTHGTALSTIINYFDKSYGFNDFMDMVYVLPWVVKMTFDDDKCLEIEKIDVLNIA
ncbi:MAG: histidine phosphatase family protein [Saccharofermentanales bacterium]